MVLLQTSEILYKTFFFFSFVKPQTKKMRNCTLRKHISSEVFSFFSFFLFFFVFFFFVVVVFFLFFFFVFFLIYLLCLNKRRHLRMFLSYLSQKRGVHISFK